MEPGGFSISNPRNCISVYRGDAQDPDPLRDLQQRLDLLGKAVPAMTHSKPNGVQHSDELLMQVARRLKIDEVFERAVEAFDD